jgi:Asp-tRNA(Asn)/Glu-tRNA(Gln) amidotransferase A subunit family amidase
MSDLLDLTAAEAAEAVRTGTVDHGELWTAYRERALADELNAFSWVSGEVTPPEVDRNASLGGVPVAVKDLFCTEGIPSQAGSKILEGYRPPYTATAVERLTSAGAPLLAKTHQDEFAMGSSTENCAYGPVLNPWDRSRVPGGSSGGSAAAVASGAAPWAIGTDTGGSIRQPAALCGIVGLKPTYGAVSRYGMIAFASSLDQAGPLTRDVTDCALLFGAMVGQDPCDSTSLHFPEPIGVPTATDLRGVRLGVPAELSGEGIEEGVLKTFRDTLDRARDLGAEIVEITLPHAPHALAAYYVIAPAEASANLARYDGVRYGLREPADRPAHDVHAARAPRASARRSSGRIMLGTYALSAATTTPTTARRRRCARRSPRTSTPPGRSCDFMVSPDQPRRRVRARRQDRRPVGDVPQRLLHGADLARRPARHLDPQRARRRAADRLPDRRPRVQREPHPRRRARAREGDRVRRLQGPRMTDYEPVIGLEIHVQLSTQTKMFCSCALSFGEEPNTRTCPVCLGLPGALPVLNARAVHFGIVMGLAFDCEIAPRSIFHRKNYFYPDNPKAYQISQYDIPLCLGGHLGDVRLHRIHLEEDAAKLIHVGESGRIHGSSSSIVDFNRGGTPLAEIVSEPDIHSAEQAREWLTLLRVTLRQLGVSDVNMEEGSLRCDANVSIRPVGSEELGTKTELKNMNSFRFVAQGINAEIERQTALLEAGESVSQETLHFDPASGRLTPLRSKEEAHDYRYFPEPDLVPLVPTAEMIQEARDALPELPAERAERYERDWGCRRRPRGCSPSGPSWATTSRRPRGRAEGFEAPCRVVGQGRAARPPDRRVRPGASNVRRRCREAGRPRRRRARSPAAPAPGARSAWWPRRRPGRDRRARGARRDGRRRRARRDRRARDRGASRHRRARARRQPEGDRRAGRPGNEGDQGTGRRRRGPRQPRWRGPLRIKRIGLL